MAELLIALAILGVISTFAISKVLQGQQADKKRAVFKETISTVQAILYQGIVTHEIAPIPASTNCSSGSYIRSQVNALKVCNSNSLTQGCWDAAAGTIGVEQIEAGFIMHNGAVVVGVNNAGCAANGWGIDWNGPDGPNVDGDDQIHLNYCAAAPCAGSRPSGMVWPNNTVSTTLYQDIFK